MTLLWVWLWCLTAMGAPSLVWQEYTAEPERWKNKQTTGMIVLPLVTNAIERGPTPLFWEIQSMDGKPHRVSIECSVMEEVFYETEVLVNPRNTGSAVIPLQGVTQYDNLNCTAKDSSGRNLASRMTMASNVSTDTVATTLFIDASQSRERFPEWMIASKLHRKEGVFVQVSETKWLPTDFTGYNGVESVVWFASERPLSEEQQQSLEEWVCFGGHLIVVGSPNLHTSTLWSPHFEPRFNYDGLGEDVLSFETAIPSWRSMKMEYSFDQLDQFKSLVQFDYKVPNDIDAYRVGRGRITLVHESVSVMEAFALLMHPTANQTGFFSGFLFDSDAKTVERNDVSNHPFFLDYAYSLKSFLKSLEVFELVPDAVMTILLAVFAVLLGPINLSLKGPRIHLIWRTPLLAIVCTVIVLCVNWVYSSASRGHSVEFAIWDGRSNNLLIRKERIYFTNSSSLETLPVQANNHLLPMRPERVDFATLVETTDGSEWVNISKLRQVQMVLSWHSIPQRRGVRVDNGVVYNDLDVSIRKLMTRDSNGEYWVSPSVEGGSSAKLVNATSEFFLWDFFPEVWQKEQMVSMHWEDLPNNTVLFVLDGKVVWDGLENTGGDFDPIDGAISNFHTVVYGVLP